MNTASVLKSLTATAVAALLAVVAMTSCEQRELCYDHEHWVELHVDFDWSGAPEAEPVTMVVYFFPDDDGSRADEVHSFEFGGRDGGSVRLAAGNYKVLCFNGGTETLLERGSTWSDLHITTDNQELLAPMNGMRQSGAPRPEESKSEEVHQAPDRLWTDVADRVNVVAGVAEQRITMTPRESTLRLAVKVDGVSNLTEGVTLSAAISGMAEALTLSATAPSGRGVTMPMSLSLMPDSTLYGSINMFGHCPDTPLKHILTIYTSNRYFFNFDVTERLHEAFLHGQHDVTIEIDSIAIPKPEPDAGSGLTPGVDGWDEVIDVYIEMN